MVVGYGKKIRKKAEAIEKKSRSRYMCPSCSRVAVKRKSSGLWECKKCSAKFASSAFEFKV